MTQAEPEGESRRRQVEEDLERYIADVVTADLDVSGPKMAWMRTDSEEAEARPLPSVDDLTLGPGPSGPPEGDGHDAELLAFPDTPSLAEGGGAWARTADLRPMVERRRNERYEFDNFVVRAIMKDAEGRVTRARVRDMSSGGLFIETASPFPFKSDVFLEVKLRSGRSLTVAGRVVFQPESGMAIRLKTDIQTRAFMLAFVDDIVDPGCEDSFRELTIVQRDTPEESSGVSMDLASLSQAWNRVLRHIEDDAVHQAFIQKCLSATRLDYALEQYRRLQTEQPDDERVTRYLTQVGTILNFQAFSRDDKTKAPKKRSPFAMKLIVIFFLGIAALWIIMMMKK